MIKTIKKQNHNALIIFTREPEAGKTKTRLMPYFSPDQCAELHRCMLKDISREMRKTAADIIVAYTCTEESNSGRGPSFLRKTFGRNVLFIRQRGVDIGSRMQNAIADALSRGYKKAVLIGTDIPEIEAETIDTAFALLNVSDVVLGPTEDGGYYLIGMKAVHPEAFNVKKYGGATVYDETTAALRKAGLTVEKAESYADIDTADDIAAFRRRLREDLRLRRSRTGRFLTRQQKISVIVPVYNEAAGISKLISQLKPYSKECEIIIVDGSSTDGTLDVLKESLGEAADDFKVLKTDKGRAVQMNAGAKASSGDILFFLHCDSRLPKGFTDEIRSVMSVNDWGCFRIRFASSNFFMLTNRIISNHRAWCRRLPFGDQGIFIDREAFFEAGMFPELPLMEDYEFSMRMKHLRGVRGPGMTRRSLTTSARRYGKGTLNILKTEAHMWRLRRLYRKGYDAAALQKMYKDVR